MELLKIEIEGFWIYKDLQVIDFTKFPKDCIIGILGDNQDQEGYLSNGSGKTGLLYAITWCHFNLIPPQIESSLSKDSIINHKSKRARVKIDELLSDGTKITIENIKTKSSKSFKLWINDELFRTNTDTLTREKLFSLIGLGGKKKVYFSDFLNSFYFTGELTKDFASPLISNQKRLEIVSRFKKLEVYDVASEESKTDLKNCEQEILLLKNSIELLENEVDKTYKKSEKLKELNLLNEKISQLEKEIKTLSKKAEKKEEYNTILQAYNEKDKEFLNKKNEINNFIDEIKKTYNSLIDKYETIETLDSQIDNFEKIDLDIVEKELEELENKGSNIINDINNLKVKISSIRVKELTEIKEALICPECKTELILDQENCLVHYNTKSIEKLIEFEKKENEKAQKEISKYQEKIKKLEDDQKLNLSLKEKLKDKRKKLLQKQLELKGLNTTKENLIKEAENSLQELIQSEYILKDGEGYILNNQYLEPKNYSEYIELENDLLLILKQLNSLNEYKDFDFSIYEDKYSQLNNLKEEQKELTDYIEKQEKYLRQIFDKKQQLALKEEEKLKYDFWVKGYKKLKNIELLEIEPQLEFYTNDILERLGTNINIEFKVNIEENGLELRLIEDSGTVQELVQFSNGQANRIGLSTGLALRDLSLYSDVDFGFTMFDEVLDGLDERGIEMFFEVINNLKGRKFVISHDNTLKNYFQYSINIVRKNHQSNIIVQTN